MLFYKSSFDIEPLSLTLHGVYVHFIHHPFNVKNSPVTGWGGLSKKSKCQKNKPFINTPIHPPKDGGVSTNHKSLNKIEISQLGQNLFDF